MSTLSTHILDTSLGRPAAGISVTLARSERDTWQKLASYVTDIDGRIQAMSEQPLQPGTYRLSFATQMYFEAQKINGLYPLIEITFLIRDAASHYHIPLLLTANGYSTYRGS